MTSSDTIEQTLTIPEELAGKRFDQAISLLLPDFSRERIKSWMKDGQCLVNGQTVKPKDKVQGLETIEVKATLPEVAHWQPQDIPISIVYEDDDLLVINKPVGMVVHPAAGHLNETLVNALLFHRPDLQQLPRAGIIHRLDKDTSGLLMVGKHLKAYYALSKALSKRRIHRHYQAVVLGVYPAGGTVKAPIARHPKDRTKMAVVTNGKPSVTHYRVMEKYRKHTLLKVQLETGRTHQIRVHMSHIKSPLVGDKTYGYRPVLPKDCSLPLKTLLQTFPRQALHAYALELLHPITQAPLCLEAPLPEDFQALVHALQEDTQTSDA